MLRRRVLPAVLTLGMFVGSYAVSELYPGVSQALGSDAFEVGKISVRMSPLEDPPDGTNDPPGWGST